MTDEDRGSTRSAPTNWRRTIVVGLALGVGLWTLSLIPDLLGALWSHFTLLIPMRLTRFLVESRWIWIALILSIPLQVVAVCRRRVEGGLSWDQRFSWAVLRRGLPTVLGVTCVLAFVSWFPNYLLRPWWADLEHFGLSALSWDAGILPYQDLLDFNFPGPMYVHWVLGKTLGWGRTVPFHVFDVLLLVGFGLVAIGWSRERFHSVTPGLVAILVAFAYYFGLEYTLTAQRDWQVPLFAVVGLMALESWRGRGGRLVSAALFALAFSFRPHVVVFAPAFLSALDENAREPGQPLTRTLVAVARWSVVAGAGCVLAFVPLAVTGTLDDFLHNFREALAGGGYHEVGKRSLVEDVAGQLGRWEHWGPFVAILATSLLGPKVLRRTALTWSLAFGFVLLYRSLSPVPHGYLGHPLVVVWSVTLGVLVGGLLASNRLDPLVSLLLVLAILFEAIPRVPTHCRPELVVESIQTLWSGAESRSIPSGSERGFSRASSHPYQWGDYQDVLSYLRRHTGPRTRVVNFLRSYPYPTVNAPVGRLTAFPSVAGILWLRWVDPDLEETFARSIERVPDAVVVWMPRVPPDHGRLKLPLIERTIRSRYAPEAKFGEFEIWRLQGATDGSDHDVGPRGE